MLALATLASTLACALLRHPLPTSPRAVAARASAPLASAAAGAHMVWFSAASDLRVHDHGGLLVAAASDDATTLVPVFALERRHLALPPSQLRRLHAALLSLERELAQRYEIPLVVRTGEAADVLAAVADECGASACHAIADDVEASTRAAQRAALGALAARGVEIVRWDASLRATPWDATPKTLPAYYPEFTAAAAGLASQGSAGLPMEVNVDDCEPLPSEGVPPLPRLLELADAATPAAVLEARAACPTAAPYAERVVSWCAEAAARKALDAYCRDGRAAFADSQLADAVAAGDDAPSLHAAAAQWLLDGGAAPSAALAQREAASRAFAPALSLGVLSPREVAEDARDAAAESGEALALGGPPAYFGRSSAASLADVVEDREWFRLLARRTLALQEAGEPAGANSDPRGSSTGDERSVGTFGYWRWGGEHLVRFEEWDAGSEYDGEAPALLLVHGFAASCEQWERLVFELRRQADEAGVGAAKLPPIYAVDLLGFGHAEKPGLSYTQHLWEAMVADFAIEVMGARPLILGGNSIGGGIAAGAAGNLRSICRGVLLCNTAGVLTEPSEYTPPAVSVGEATVRRDLPKAYSPLPLVGQRGLDLFGEAVIGAIYPSIRSRLADIYANNQGNADAALALAIEQGASSPGSANVIGSGQKLPPQRPLNEVLGGTHGFGGPVLVAQGADDRVSGPKRAVQRAADLARLRDGVTVELIDGGGHCCMDDAPRGVAAALLRWLPQGSAYARSA